MLPSLADVAPLAGAIVAWLPAAVSDTVLPPTVLPSVSRSVTNTIAVVVPSAATPDGSEPGAIGGARGSTPDTFASGMVGVMLSSTSLSALTLGEPRPT